MKFKQLSKAEQQKRIEAEFQALASRMDKQEAYFAKLRAFVDKHGREALPLQHRSAYLAACLRSGKPWRKQWMVITRIKRAAKIAARNKYES